MEIYLKRTQSGLVPLYASDYEAIKKYKIGDEVKAKISKPRNLKFHKKAFALLNMAFENQDQYDSMRAFRAVVTLKAGFFDAIPTDKGIVYLPQSISFSSMDQAEFEEWYSRVLDVIIKMIGFSEDDVQDNLMNFM